MGPCAKYQVPRRPSSRGMQRGWGPCVFLTGISVVLAICSGAGLELVSERPRGGPGFMSMRRVLQSGEGLRGSHAHFEDTRCIGASPPGRTPLFEYCKCEEGQQKDFSRPEVEARFNEQYGAKASAERAPSGPQRMRFLMLAMEREQLTKGRIHLGEAMLMSQILNRTFVLSKVGNSRIGYDRALPFCTYMDTAKVGQFVDWVSEDVILKRLLGTPQDPTVKLVPLMLVKPYQHCDKTLWDKLEPKAGFEDHPVTQALFAALEAGEMVCVPEKPRRFVQQATQDLLKALKEDPLDAATVILVFKVGDNMYFSPHAQIDADDHAFFAPHLVKAAHTMEQMFLSTYGSVNSGTAAEDELADMNGRKVSAVGKAVYLAIQWRSEYALLRLKTDSQLLEKCVQGLLAIANDTMTKMDLSIVFLAADITSEGEPTSATLERLPMAQQIAARRAIRRVYEELKPKSWSSIEPMFHLLDNGVQGILDKLMCMRAPIFMFAPRSCGGLFSSYTASITAERKKDRRKYPSFAWILPKDKVGK